MTDTPMWRGTQYTVDRPDPDHPDPEFVHHLRTTARAAGLTVDTTTLAMGTPTNAQPTYGVPGWVTEWTVTAAPFTADTAAATLIRSGPKHAVYGVPEATRQGGGGVRVYHEFGEPVTVHAFTEDWAWVGYMFASAVDQDSEHVECAAGTVYLYVRPDSVTVEDLVAASSLGTPEAVALRASVSDEKAAAVVARANTLKDMT